MQRFKKPRLSSRLQEAASNLDWGQHAHVVFGGTGAVGGAAALALVSLYSDLRQYLARSGGGQQQGEPVLVVTGRSRRDLRHFSSVLFGVEERDRGEAPKRLEHDGYRTAGGVQVLLTLFQVDPEVPALSGFLSMSEDERRQAASRLLAESNHGRPLKSPSAEDGFRALSGALERGIHKPYTDLLRSLETKHPALAGRLRSVIVGIPLASLTAYKLQELDAVAPYLGLPVGGAEVQNLKDLYLQAICDDLATVKNESAEEVLVAHTTAVGGMFDETSEGTRVIRLGFAHSGLDENLRLKQIFAEHLAELYAERGIKMLVTAAAVGVDAIVSHHGVPLKGSVLDCLRRARAEGSRALPESDLESGPVRIYTPAEFDLLGADSCPLLFAHGRPLIVEHALRSGENGYFSVSNSEALYRVMRVTTSTELGLVLARTALFGDQGQSSYFENNICYYVETDNSRQVFDLLAHPLLAQDQLSGLQPKALQDLGSAKHQSELHTLGLLILAHRLKTLQLELIPSHVNLSAFDPREFFEEHSEVLRLEEVAGVDPSQLALDLVRLARARSEQDLEYFQRFFQPDPSRQEAARRVFQKVLHAVWAIPSLGSPIIFEQAGRYQILTGPYAAAINLAPTDSTSYQAFFQQRARRLGIETTSEEFERLVELYVSAFGFVDLRPVAVLVTARSEAELLEGRVRVFRTESDFLSALGELEPGSYFTTSGLIALIVRLKGLSRLAREFHFELGSANEFRCHFRWDSSGHALLVPGLVEAFRMVSEGLEKNTGTERLDGRWGYYL